MWPMARREAVVWHGHAAAWCFGDALAELVRALRRTRRGADGHAVKGGGASSAAVQSVVGGYSTGGE